MPEDIKNFHKAYMHLNYYEFLVVLGGRDDGYWQEIWENFITAAKALGRLGSFNKLLVEEGKKYAD